jgi:glycosyltransferase involved in cell wall biosynthesis
VRLLYVVHQYLPDHVGGTELYTCWLAGEMARQGHQVAVFYRREKKGSAIEHRIDGDVQVWGTRAGSIGPTRRFLATFGEASLRRAWKQVLEEWNPDLVHIQHLMGLPVSLIRAFRPRRIPYVVTLWDYWWLCPNAQLLTNYSGEVCEGPRYWNCARCMLARAGFPGLWPAIPFLAGLAAWRNRLLRGVLDRARVLIAPTEFVQRWYAAHGVPEEKIVVLAPGLDNSMLPPQPPRPADDTVRFAYIGGLSWQKGVHVLVEAFSGVQGEAELWVAGDESFDPAYVSRLKALATPNVRFLGRLDRKGVWETLTQVDVVVVPSLWYETFSFLISEAFAAGLPVLASRLGALADRVRDGVDGLLLPPGDVAAWRAAMQRLLDEPDLLPRLRAGVRPPMTMEEHVDRLEALYAGCVPISSGLAALQDNCEQFPATIVDRTPSSW